MGEEAPRCTAFLVLPIVPQCGLCWFVPDKSQNIFSESCPFDTNVWFLWLLFVTFSVSHIKGGMWSRIRTPREQMLLVWSLQWVHRIVAFNRYGNYEEIRQKFPSCSVAAARLWAWLLALTLQIRLGSSRQHMLVRHVSGCAAGCVGRATVLKTINIGKVGPFGVSSQLVYDTPQSISCF